MSDKKHDALIALIEAAHRIPVLVHGIQYDMCLGCGTREGDMCREDCWARELEEALVMAMDASGMVEDLDLGVEELVAPPEKKDPKAN